MNNHAHVLRPRDGVDFDFCLYSLAIRPDVGDLVTGNTRPKLNQALAASIPMVLPPLAEQRRIGEILKKQLAAAEQALAAAEAQREVAAALPAAYLQSVLENPDASNWPETTLGRVAASVNNGIYKSAEHYGMGQPFLRMYNVRNDSSRLKLDVLARVAVNDSEQAKFGVRTGDLLFSRVNSAELVGKCGLITEELEGYVFENMLIRVRLVAGVEPVFVAHLAQTQTFRRQLQGLAKRAIGQASINSRDLRSIRISLPSAEAQRQIASELSQRMVAAEQLAEHLDNQRLRLSSLPAALLRSAFQGKL